MSVIVLSIYLHFILDMQLPESWKPTGDSIFVRVAESHDGWWPLGVEDRPSTSSSLSRERALPVPAHNLCLGRWAEKSAARLMPETSSPCLWGFPDSPAGQWRIAARSQRQACKEGAAAPHTSPCFAQCMFQLGVFSASWDCSSSKFVTQGGPWTSVVASWSELQDWAFILGDLTEWNLSSQK